MKRKIKLKTAIIFPFMLVILLILMTFIVIWRNDYKTLGTDQGVRVVEGYVDSTTREMQMFFGAPMDLADIVSSDLAYMAAYAAKDTRPFNDYMIQLLAMSEDKWPQISVISFGLEDGRASGLRDNGPGAEPSLIVQDHYTDMQLHIYSGPSENSELIANIEGYDPRTRPWYTPVKQDPITQWSTLYVNADEKRAMTISALAPIMDEEFYGVVSIDITANGIYDYLRNLEGLGHGVVYITHNAGSDDDPDYRIVAHSTDEDTVQIIETGDEAVAQFLPARSSTHPLVRASAEYLEDGGFIQHVAPITLDNQDVVITSFSLAESVQLDWHVVIVVPLEDLIGDVVIRQNRAILNAIGVVVLFGILGIVFINNLIRPIRGSVQTARAISDGDYSHMDDMPPSSIHEIHELTFAMTSMTRSLQSAFTDLKSQQQKYRTLIEGVDLPVFSIGIDRHIISTNKSFRDLIQMDAGALDGAHLADIPLLKPYREEMGSLIQLVIDTRRKQSAQMELVIEDMHKQYMVSFIPFIEDQVLKMTLITMADLSELLAAQTQLAQYLASEKDRLAQQVEAKKQELEQALKELMDKEKYASLGSLVAGIAHEINTPLGVAITAASYLENETQLVVGKLRENKLTKRDFQTYIDRMMETTPVMNTNLHRAADLVRSFKAVAVNQSSEALVEFNIHEYLHSVILSMQHEYRNKSVDFQVDGDKHLMIRSYPGAFSQIMTNLIMNSLIHGFNGRDGGMISIRIHQTGHTLHVQYQDDGVGMPPEVLKRLYDPFFTTNRSRGGTGLGMNIVYNIVRTRLNGKIHCRSTMGQGTTFQIEFPVQGGAS